MEFEENNDICVSSKKQRVRSAEVRCRSWWGVADEQMNLLARQSWGGGLTLNGVLHDVQYLDGL